MHIRLIKVKGEIDYLNQLFSKHEEPQYFIHINNLAELKNTKKMFILKFIGIKLVFLEKEYKYRISLC